MQKSFVYFISYEDGPIKIGRAVNVIERMRSLQTGLPHKLEVLGVLEGGHDLERKFHQEFAAIRLQGEWFKRDPELLHLIETRAKSIEEALDDGRKHACRSCTKLADQVEILKDRLKRKIDSSEAVHERKFVLRYGQALLRHTSRVMYSLLDECAELSEIVDEIERDYKISFANSVHVRLRQVADEITGEQWQVSKRLLYGFRKDDPHFLDGCAQTFLIRHFSNFNTRTFGPGELYKIFSTEKHSTKSEASLGKQGGGFFKLLNAKKEARNDGEKASEISNP